MGLRCDLRVCFRNLSCCSHWEPSRFCWSCCGWCRCWKWHSVVICCPGCLSNLNSLSHMHRLCSCMEAQAHVIWACKHSFGSSSEMILSLSLSLILGWCKTCLCCGSIWSGWICSPTYCWEPIAWWKNYSEFFVFLQVNLVVDALSLPNSFIGALCYLNHR